MGLLQFRHLRSREVELLTDAHDFLAVISTRLGRLILWVRRVTLPSRSSARASVPSISSEKCHVPLSNLVLVSLLGASRMSTRKREVVAATLRRHPVVRLAEGYRCHREAQVCPSWLQFVVRAVLRVSLFALASIFPSCGSFKINPMTEFWL